MSHVPRQSVRGADDSAPYFESAPDEDAHKSRSVNNDVNRPVDSALVQHTPEGIADLPSLIEELNTAQLATDGSALAINPCMIDTKTYYVDTYYQSVENPPDSHIFDLDNSEAYFHDRDHCFFLRKKRPDEEINMRKLPQHIQKPWLDKGGAREKEQRQNSSR